MESTNQQFSLIDKRQSTKQSAIILTHHPHHHLNNHISSSKKHLATSTFINYHQYKSPQLAASRSLKFQNNLGKNTQEIQREKSMEPGTIREKVHKESDQQYSEHINNNFIRLKVQQMAFKFKTKIATLLKQINISGEELNKYSRLIKIDDMLSFLSEKIKQKLSLTEVSQNNSLRLREREKDVVRELSEMAETLRKKLEDKEIAQKQQRTKLKENHNQIKSLYDQINQKQRQISNKTTQNYQLTIISQEYQKQISSIQSKYATLDKQYEILKLNAQNGHKSIYNHCANLQDREKQYQKEIKALKQTISMLSEKEIQLLNFNRGISQQVGRWRQRFQSQRDGKAFNGQELKWSGMGAQGTEGVSKSDGRKELQTLGKDESKSLRSYTLQETNQLLTIIAIHQQQINELKNENVSLKLYKKQFELLVQQKRGRSQGDKGKGQQSREMLSQQSKYEIENVYKKKMQEMSGQWRQKLIQIVDSYSMEDTKMKFKIQQLEKQKREMQKKIFMLANQKYQLQCKIIHREDQIYGLNKQLYNFTTNQSLNRKDSKQIQQFGKRQSYGGQIVKPLEIEKGLQQIKNIDV